METPSSSILFVDDGQDDRDMIRNCCVDLYRLTQTRFACSGEELFHLLAE